MKVIKLPKRNGGFRTVVVPSSEEKRELRACLPFLQGTAMALDIHGVQHGFTPGRSPVTNALAHVGKLHTLSMDLKDCFDNVRLKHIYEIMSPPWGYTIPKSTFFDNRKHACGCMNCSMCKEYAYAAQGLPTSPALCNIALSKLDDKILSLLRTHCPDAVYTRYADDLSISSDHLADLMVFKAYVEQKPRLCGQTINRRKTRVLSAKVRHITGVGVTATGVQPTRKTKRRLRAARHQGRYKQAQGLASWAKLITPSQATVILRLHQKAMEAAGQGCNAQATSWALAARLLVQRELQTA